MAIDKAAVARSVKCMGKKGYLKTKKFDRDKRAKELYLSETGKELFRFMLDLHEEWLKEILEDLEPKESKNFTKIINNISEKAKNKIKNHPKRQGPLKI